MVSRFSAYTPRRAAEELLTAASDAGPVYAINQPANALRAVLLAAADCADAPRLRVVCERSPLEATSARFPLAARAASLVAADRLAVRSHEQLRVAPVFVTTERIRTLMAIDGVAAHGDRASGAYVEAVTEVAPELWADGEPVAFDTPPLDRTLESARALDESFAGAFERCVETATDQRLSFDPVAVGLVLAAEQGLSAAAVRDWLTDADLASRPTVARRERTLVDAGLLARAESGDRLAAPENRAWTDRETLLDRLGECVSDPKGHN